MIKEIGLQNIRIFEEELDAKFPLPTLSVFCGTNSCGKSTILKTLLLLRQSQGIRESSGALLGRLRFVGSQVDLGNYSSFVSYRDTQRDISITLIVENEFPYSWVQFLRTLKKSKDSGSDSENLQEDDPVKYLLKCCFTFTERRNLNEEYSNEVEEIDPYATQGILRSADYELSVEGENLLSWKVRLVGEKEGEEEEESTPDYEILIPRDYFEEVGGARMMDLDLAEDGHYVRASTVIRGILPVQLVSKIHVDKIDDEPDENSKQPLWSFFSLPPHIENALRGFHNTLAKIHYLGPLRSPAKRYYVTNLDIIPGLDPAGEFLPYILRNKENEPEVWNIQPGRQEIVKEKLSLSLNTWLYYLRVGEVLPQDSCCSEIEVSTLKGVLVEFAIKTTDGTGLYALADSGFGYSQVLPILVRGLLAAPGNILIVEQPELHLNPAIQVRLAEFFVAMARAGKQILIETHSEHIVNAVRVFSAEDESGELSANSAIFFIDAEAEILTIHELSIKPDGTVPKWPRNFFGEAASLSARILRAQKHHREKAKSQRTEQ